MTEHTLSLIQQLTSLRNRCPNEAYDTMNEAIYIVKQHQAEPPVQSLNASPERVQKEAGIECDGRTQPVSSKPVSLREGATAMHAAGYTNDLSERDGFIQEEYIDQARACDESWWVKYVP